MGRLIRLTSGLVVLAAGALGAAPHAFGFDSFGTTSVDSTYGEEIRFEVELEGETPERIELLLRTPQSDADFVAPVDVGGTTATYVWNTAGVHVTPNTPITYRWRATDAGGVVTLSPPGLHRYEDDRAGLDWRTATFGTATVHWYGGAEARARRFGELTAGGVDRAEVLLGTELAGPVDIFVYASRDAFFGALGPGVREWTGAAAYPELRTVFMWLEGGSDAYLERVLVHEVTHVVFHDATDNPYHEPATWLNEGIAVWSETQDAGEERSIVEREASGGGLFAFEAITERFPIGEGGGHLAYAEGTTMVDEIIDRFGPEAIAAIADAYREGASDEEALETGTGVEAETLYADFYAAFGVEPPEPISPEPIPPSNVEKPPAVGMGGGPGDDEPDDGPEPAPIPGRADGDGGVLILVPLAIGGVLAVGAAVLLTRRAERRE